MKGGGNPAFFRLSSAASGRTLDRSIVLWGVYQMRIWGIVAFGLLGCSAAQAEICEYRLSELISGAGATATVAAAGATAAGHVAFDAAGFYIIIHSTSGAAMIGSTLAGTSAAGTVGIIAGSGGVLGTVASVIAAPVTLIAAGLTAVGVSGLELGCYLLDDTRIDDYDEVLAALRLVAAAMRPEYFQLVEPESNQHRAYIRVRRSEEGDVEEYDVANLYIVGGQLRHHDWGPNTVIGDIAAFGSLLPGDEAPTAAVVPAED